MLRERDPVLGVRVTEVVEWSAGVKGPRSREGSRGGAFANEDPRGPNRTGSNVLVRRPGAVVIVRRMDQVLDGCVLKESPGGQW